MFLNDGKIFINSEEFKVTGMDINIIENGYAFVQAYAIYKKDVSSINKIKFNIEYVDPDTVKTLSISNDCEFNIN